jgi:hypothetical protein
MAFGKRGPDIYEPEVRFGEEERTARHELFSYTFLVRQEMCFVMRETRGRRGASLYIPSRREILGTVVCSSDADML